MYELRLLFPTIPYHRIRTPATVDKQKLRESTFNSIWLQGHKDPLIEKSKGKEFGMPLLSVDNNEDHLISMHKW
ncbi:hypothetical protein CEXT_57301 [Caerostris extrusa]|uniref:Uncharacterized protein n=1 Tax=Caerostris extrusa TaxID=172846 RepID=A0AAV4SV60_CAEEX|nr:hypothetical protein CEXT_57301 [Caerostris extrusa]